MVPDLAVALTANAQGHGIDHESAHLVSGRAGETAGAARDPLRSIDRNAPGAPAVFSKPMKDLIAVPARQDSRAFTLGRIRVETERAL